MDPRRYKTTGEEGVYVESGGLAYSDSDVQVMAASMLSCFHDLREQVGAPPSEDGEVNGAVDGMIAEAAGTAYIALETLGVFAGRSDGAQFVVGLMVGYQLGCLGARMFNGTEETACN